MMKDKYEGRPKVTRNLVMKNCVFIPACLNFRHLQSTLHLMQYTHGDSFPVLNTVFELIGFDTF